HFPFQRQRRLVGSQPDRHDPELWHHAAPGQLRALPGSVHSARGRQYRSSRYALGQRRQDGDEGNRLRSAGRQRARPRQAVRRFKKITIIGGVKNLFNTDPPFSATYDTNTGAGSSWEPRVADPRGRSYTLRVDYKFY